MIAKLRACEYALANGVDEVVIVDGRGAALASAAGDAPQSATRLVGGPAGNAGEANLGGATVRMVTA
jgi:hypothetical protein